MPDIIDSGPYQGWSTWRARNDGRFVDALGDMMFLKQPDGSTRTAIETGRRHSNGLGFLHGGFLMSFIDMAMFTAITDRLGPGIGAVTLSCATEFLGGGRPEAAAGGAHGGAGGDRQAVLRARSALPGKRRAPGERLHRHHAQDHPPPAAARCRSLRMGTVLAAYRRLLDTHELKPDMAQAGGRGSARHTG